MVVLHRPARYADGHAFNIEAVIFHLPQQRLFGIADAWIGHYAVLDESSGEYVFDQTRVFDVPSLPLQSQHGFDLKNAIVQLRGGDGHDELHCGSSDGRFKLNLAVSDLREPILHGGSGYVPYGIPTADPSILTADGSCRHSDHRGRRTPGRR